MAKAKKRRHSRRRFGINPGSVTEGFKPRVLRGILPMGLGALTNTFLTQFVANRFDVIRNNAILRIGTGILGAGAIGYAASKVSKKDGVPAFLGAMTSTGIDVIGIIQDKYEAMKPVAAPVAPPAAITTAGATPAAAALALPAPGSAAAAAGVAGVDDINFANDGTQGSLNELLRY